MGLIGFRVWGFGFIERALKSYRWTHFRETSFKQRFIGQRPRSKRVHRACRF